MAGKYYISNGDCYIANTEDISYVKGHIKGIRRYRQTDAINVLKEKFFDNPEWVVQKLFHSRSSKNYVITNASLFVAKCNKTTTSFEFARSFRSPADAEAYLNNHSELKKSFLNPVIIDEDFNTVEFSPRKTFTAEQLKELGKPKLQTARRICFGSERRDLIYKRDKGICQLCGSPVDYAEFTVDHINPLSRGGSNSLDNLRCTCKSCNKLKDALYDSELQNSASNILGLELFKNPQSEMADKLIRCIVRGSIARVG